MTSVKTSVKTALRRRRTRRPWRILRRHGWWIGLGAILVGIILVQLLYPAQYTLPLAHYNHEPYGFKHRDELTTREQTRFLQTKIELQLSDTTERVDLRTMGASLRENASLEVLTHYPKAWRFVPFSILFFRPDVTSLPVQFSEAPLSEFTHAFSEAHVRLASDANLEFKDGEVRVQAATVGRTIDANLLTQLVRQKEYDISGVARIIVPEKAIAPQTTAADFEQLRDEAKMISTKRIELTVEGQTHPHSPAREQLVSWLKLGEREGKAVLELNRESVGAYLAELNKEVGRPAGETLVSVVDGREKTRQEGLVGKQINIEHFEQEMSSALFTPGQYKYVRIGLEDVAPNARSVYSYTNSQAGLQAKVRELGTRHDIRVSLQQLDGAGWQASYRGDESTPSASTYKLYIALKLFEELDAGRMSWSASMQDTNVAGCFDRMIIVSTNQCAEEWLHSFGRSQLNSFLYQRGISQATTFTSQGPVRTSSDDLVRVVQGVYNGSLAKGANREKLLDMMSRQVWRKGIPSGTAGWTSNKVGFLWDYVHDVGVVHHPRGTYVLAIMTKGASYATIAQITREIEALMYP